MKRILFFVLTMTAFTSCKKTNENLKKDTMKENNEIVASTDCRKTYSIDRKKAGDSWADLSENSSLICSFTDYRYFINLSKIQNDENNKEKAKWLRLNSDKIVFEESYKHIEGSHVITTTIPDDVEYVSLTLTDLKKKIIELGGDFDKNGYENYLKIISIDPATNAIKFELSPFSSDANTVFYSIPFLRSIIINNSSDLDSNPNFKFGKAIIDNDETIFFVVSTKDPNVFLNYDYSRIPKDNKIVE